MRVLVIGSEGNIGRPLVAHLRESHEVRTADIVPGWRPDYSLADINNPADLADAFAWQPEVVYLLASVVSRVTCEQAASLAVATNVGGVNNVVQMTKRAGARLVFFSTSEVYGPTDGPMDERTTPRPNNRYGLTKWLAEQLIAYEDIESVVLRPFMVYGEDESRGSHRSAMIRFADDLAHGRPIEVHRGTVRSWLHVSDAVEAFGRAAELTGKHVVNVGHPEPVATEDLAELIRLALDAPRHLVRVADQPDRMTPAKVPLLERQRDLLGFTPLVSVAEGVERVCEAVR